MAFLETPRFPSCVAFGAITGPQFSSVRTVVASGFDDVLIRYEQPLHRFVLEHANRTQIEHDSLLNFFNAVKGMGHRFRVKDYADYSATIANGVLAPLHGPLIVGTSGVGYGTKTYLLQKKYTAGALTTYRNIQKPIATVSIYRAGVLQTLTTHYTIDYTTGVVTFVPGAANTKSILTHTSGADHEFVLQSVFAPTNIAVGQRIYIDTVGGSAGDTLNNLSHEVTGVSTTTITIATSTVGLTATGGSAYLLPQSTETLTWAGEFDVPCRFLSDEASFEIVDRSGGGLLYSWSGINLTEVRIALT